MLSRSSRWETTQGLRLSRPSTADPRYFHQAFAQVTNPPMDPIREKLVMSLRTYVGRHGSLLEETQQQAHMIELDSPVLSDAEIEKLRSSSDEAFRSEWIDVLYDPSSVPMAWSRPSRSSVTEPNVSLPMALRSSSCRTVIPMRIGHRSRFSWQLARCIID